MFTNKKKQNEKFRSLSPCISLLFRCEWLTWAWLYSALIDLVMIFKNYRFWLDRIKLKSGLCRELTEFFLFYHSNDHLYCFRKNRSFSVKSSGYFLNGNAAIDNQVFDFKIDCGVPSWSVVEYLSLYADALDTQRIHALFSDGVSSIMFDCRNVRQNIDISAWAQRGKLLWNWFPNTLKEIFWFGTPLARHVQKVNFLRSLLDLVQFVDFASVGWAYVDSRSPDLRSWHLGRNGDAWLRKLKLKTQKRHGLRCPCFSIGIARRCCTSLHWAKWMLQFGTTRLGSLVESCPSRSNGSIFLLHCRLFTYVQQEGL